MICAFSRSRKSGRLWIPRTWKPPKPAGITDFDRFIEGGALLCDPCRARFPILHGLPVLLPYATPIHREFEDRFRDRLPELNGYASPAREPVSGEQFVMRPFSREWLEYDYDGLIWDLSYEDHERRFLAEIGPTAAAHGTNGFFVEMGCGIGLTTQFAQKNLRADAVGVDLSLAVLQATRHFRDNPFLHFVQGSAFYLPLRAGLADVLYTHGVLHHTHSTREAARSIARAVAPGGWFYIWVYGPDSLRGSPLRRAAGWLEAATRPLIARHTDTLPSRTVLRALAVGYLLVNRYHHMRDPTVGKYDYRQALHACRDRFTPLFAHRHDRAEVAGWLRRLGFVDIEDVDWRTMPSANQANYRRNTGIRARRDTRSAAS